VSRITWAQAYPTRPVRVIVPFGSAGATDIVARLIGQWLSERLGQPFVIENRPGAGGNLGTEAVVRAPPDGYTLAVIGAPSAINATLYEKLNFNFIRDITPVASIIRFPNVMVVNPSVPATTVPEFIAYAKANPGKLNMASPGNGSTPHVTGELFKMMTGINMVHVPYRSVAAGITDMLSGQVQVTFGTTASTIAYIRAGTLRALAVTTATRSEALPDLPTIAEFVPGYEASAWFGMGAPKGTPPEVIAVLNKAINEALADPNIKARLAEMGGMYMGGTPADFGKIIVDETEKWRKVVEFAGASVD
jgi:tripartite-type tricarboxylate transporter receptor subunit TctC